MHFKLIMALVEEEYTDKVIHAAREAGATGSTVISSARGEGLETKKTFFGLNLESHRDVLMFLVEEHMSRHILERISEVGEFEKPDTGIAFQVDVEDVVGNALQKQVLKLFVEEEI